LEESEIEEEEEEEEVEEEEVEEEIEEEAEEEGEIEEEEVEEEEEMEGEQRNPTSGSTNPPGASPRGSPPESLGASGGEGLREPRLSPPPPPREPFPARGTTEVAPRESTSQKGGEGSGGPGATVSKERYEKALAALKANKAQMEAMKAAKEAAEKRAEDVAAELEKERVALEKKLSATQGHLARKTTELEKLRRESPDANKIAELKREKAQLEAVRSALRILLASAGVASLPERLVNIEHTLERTFGETMAGTAVPPAKGDMDGPRVLRRIINAKLADHKEKDRAQREREHSPTPPPAARPWTFLTPVRPARADIRPGAVSPAPRPRRETPTSSPVMGPKDGGAQLEEGEVSCTLKYAAFGVDDCDGGG
jgi:hypothetical protein